jgi:hypothetical protein
VRCLRRILSGCHERIKSDSITDSSDRFLFSNVFFSEIIGLYLAYIFLRPRKVVEPGAPPSGGPTTPVGSSGAAEEPPSVG